MMMAPIKEIDNADIKGPLTVFPNKVISMGGIHSESPK
jgi:hypothetical protein